MCEKKIKEVFSHIIGELELYNIFLSLHESDFEKLEKVRCSIYEFTLLTNTVLLLI